MEIKKKGIVFLSGGGSEKDSFFLDKEFAKLLKKDDSLLYIPIAINTIKHPFNDCFDWVKKVFNQFGFINIKMWTGLRNKNINDLKKFAAIYIGGGNTFKLLKELKKTGFDKLLLKFHNDGGHIYGGSAGAIILGNNIITSSKGDVNEVGLEDLNGLNLCNGYSVWCHYSPEENDKIFDFITKFNLKIIALSEDAGLIIDNDKMKTTPTGRILILNN